MHYRRDLPAETNFEDRIVPQEQWKTRQPSFVPNMRPPARYIVFGYAQPWKRPHTNPDPTSLAEYNNSLADARLMFQSDTIKYPDTKYNFLLSPDGLVYEGRGFYKVPSLPVKLRPINPMAYYITFIGDFTMEYPAEYMFQMRKEFIQFAIQRGFVTEKFLMYTLRNQLQCPFDDFNFVKVSPNLTIY